MNPRQHLHTWQCCACLRRSNIADGETFPFCGTCSKAETVKIWAQTILVYICIVALYALCELSR